jgi:hypothetical protein
MVLSIIALSLGFLSLLYWRWRYAEEGPPAGPGGPFTPAWRYAGASTIPVSFRRSDLAALPDVVLPPFVRSRFRFRRS